MTTAMLHRQGFTLIELSIVLVIIGLIVGGVLVGQDLIGAAAVRAQISQIEKYNTAANTFKAKYGYLPGDIPDPYASQFGFQARGPLAGQGDGNGILEGNAADAAGQNSGVIQGAGETALFWADLSAAGLIDGFFNTGGTNYPSATTAPFGGSQSSASITLSTTPNLNSWLPQGRAGQGNYIYVYSLGTGVNYFGLSAVNALGWTIASTPGLTVAQAYGIDRKIDDGSPRTGSVMAAYLSFNLAPWVQAWAAGGGLLGANPGTTASPSAASCYDNGGNANAAMQYSMEISNGSNPNCALSFKMQGAAR